MTKNMAPGKPVYNTVFCTGIYKSSFDEMDKKFPAEMGILIPILIAQVMTPYITKKKNEVGIVNLLQNEMKVTNQHTPNHESLVLYFIMNILFILAVVFIGLCNA